MKIVIPRLGNKEETDSSSDDNEITSKNKALKFANWSFFAVIVILLALSIPENGWLETLKLEANEESPLMMVLV